jgi:hypothetical protein
MVLVGKKYKNYSFGLGPKNLFYTPEGVEKLGFLGLWHTHFMVLEALKTDYGRFVLAILLMWEIFQ